MPYPGKSSCCRDRCVLIFLKSPDAGLVKSRLSCDIDSAAVLSLYRNFGLDLLETLRKGSYAFEFFFYPKESKEKISNWLGEDFSYNPQHGHDLGERMKNAFVRSFSEGYRRVVLIGSDIPDLTNKILLEAFELESHDAVVGPAFDGGYYLIGFKNDTFLPEIFDGMPWGTDAVYAATTEIFKKNNYRVRILTKWRDVDRIQDLKALVDRNRHTEFANSRTMTFIAKNMDLLFKEGEDHSCE